MSQLSDNARLQALVDRLEQLTGENIGDLTGASNNRLLGYMLVLLMALEPGSGEGGGADGKSAYQIWLEQPGNAGKTLQEFLTSLEGADGEDGEDGQDAPVIAGDRPTFIQSSQPTHDGAYFWVKLLPGGNAEFYYEDGL